MIFITTLRMKCRKGVIEMCVIIVKDKKDRLPSEGELKKCFEYNPDGAGFMYTDNGKVIIDKGYMTWKTFIKHYNKLVKKYDNFKDKCLVIHCRIGTGGGNNIHNTHGYPLTNSIEEMQKTYNTCDVGLMHNGVISDYKPQEDYYNDTQEFIKEFVYNLQKFDKHFYKRAYFRDMIRDNSHSKWAILDKDDNVYTCGVFTVRNGLKFSNTNHEYVYNYRKTSTPAYASQQRLMWEDIWDDYNYPKTTGGWE
jgi:predicted glutamine amidotransferase